MWTRTRVTERLGLEVPIFQGPFGGGHSTVELAAAVSNAGGLGAFGANHLPPAEISRVIEQLRARTARPFAVNLWVPIPGQDDAQVEEAAIDRMREQLRPEFASLGLEPPPRPTTFGQRYSEQVEALLAARPPVFSFVMGVPDRAILMEAKVRGIATVGAATTVEEGVALAEAGVDLVVASGSDAGGHRSSFLRPVKDSLVGTMSLVPQLTRELKIPVVAAGGISDGRGIAAALALGAEGVQIGTAFLAAPESGAPEVHRALLGTAAARITRLTRAFSGRDARGIVNALMEKLESRPGELLPYPAQNALTTPLRKAAGAAGRADLLALWAGQAAPLARRLRAAEVLRLLAEETDAVLRSERLKPRG